MLNDHRPVMLSLFSTLLALPAAGQAPGSGQGEAAHTPDADRSSPAGDDGPSVSPEDELGDQSATGRKRSGDWEFSLSPYLWMSSVRSDVDAGPVSTSMEACFTDLLKSLELGGSLRFEGMRDDRWGFYLDGTYLNLGDDGRARVGPFRLRGLGVEVDFTQAWLDFGGIYRFGEEGRAFDLMLGGRYTYSAVDVSVGPFVDADTSAENVTPVVGGRIEYALSPKWIATLKADAGGFGVDEAADLVWGVTGLLGYKLSDKATIGFGYRYYDIGFDGDRADVDIKYYGPMMGMSLSF